LLCCWKEDQEKEKPAEENGGGIGENEADKSSDNLKHMSFDEPDKEKTPDCDVTEINKDRRALRINRPSIILSMEGSVHHVVLYEEKEQKKKKRTKHKKREKVKKPKKQ